MRVLLQNEGSVGNILPLLATGSVLRDRGHEVRAFVNEAFAGVVERAGLLPVVTGSRSGVDAVEADPGIWRRRRGWATVLRHRVFPDLLRTVGLLEEHVDEGRTVLVGGTLGFAARLVRERRTLPMVTMVVSPCMFESLHRTPVYGPHALARRTPRWMKRLFRRAAARLVRRIVGVPLDEARERLGLAPLRGTVFGSWIPSTDRIVAAFPDWFGPPQPDWPEPVRFAGFPRFDTTEEPEADLVRWMEDGPPPVVLAASSAFLGGADYFDAGLAATAALGVRVLVVTRGRDALPSPLPPHARHVPSVPFKRVFLRAAAVVHHGGVGTCAIALRAGVPQLTAPAGFDQFDNASRLEDLGAGASLPLRRFRRPSAERALARVLGDGSMRARCADLAARDGVADGAERAADLIEETYREFRP